MAAYLDSSAFDHLYKKIGCTAADIANLRKRIYGRELSILLSIHTLEEILLDRKARPELLVAKIKLTLSLGNFRRMVKPCDQLLTDDIQSYASTGEAARPFLDAKLQNVISEGIAALVESDGEELDDDMIAALEEGRRQKEQFLRGMREAELRGSLPERIPFTQYFDMMAPVVAKAFADRAGTLRKCEERGIEGLLEVRTVRMSVGATLSLVYGQTFEGWTPKIGDSGDLLHATSAAAVADTFVTGDARLRTILAQVPLANLEVIDLPGFLQRVA